MNTIIVATNYTDISENAVEFAASVAQINHARLILYNDYDVPTTAINARLPGEVIEKMIAENERRLTEISKKLAANYAIEVIPVATFTFFNTEIHAIIDHYQADMVVMGMAPESIDQDLFGNTTTMAIKNLPIRVLAVPLGAKFENTKKVLFACDVLNGTSIDLLEQVKSATEHVGGSVEVLLINETIEEIRNQGGSAIFIDEVSHQLDGIEYTYHNVKSDSIVDAIRREILTYGADMLIMVPHQHSFWHSFIHRSKTRMMAAGLNIPLLSIPVEHVI